MTSFQDTIYKQATRDIITDCIFDYAGIVENVSVLTMTGPHADHESQILDRAEKENKTVNIVSYDHFENRDRQYRPETRGKSVLTFANRDVRLHNAQITDAPQVEWYDFCGGPIPSIPRVFDQLRKRGWTKGTKNLTIAFTVDIGGRRNLRPNPTTWLEHNEYMESAEWLGETLVHEDGTKVMRMPDPAKAKNRRILKPIKVTSSLDKRGRVNSIHNKFMGITKKHGLTNIARVVYKSESGKVMLFLAFQTTSSDVTHLTRERKKNWFLDYTGECGTMLPRKTKLNKIQEAQTVRSAIQESSAKENRELVLEQITVAQKKVEPQRALPIETFEERQKQSGRVLLGNFFKKKAQTLGENLINWGRR